MLRAQAPLFADGWSARVVLFQECLSEANIINNQNPLVWGHLTLLALRTGRESEATLVYKEALKLGLSDVPLLRSIGEQQLALGKYTLVNRTPNFFQHVSA